MHQEPMILYPAIDLLQGQCVRLHQGRYDQVTVYSSDPLAVARRFQAEILPRAEKSARTLGRAFELGEAGLLDVIDARRVLLDTRREYLDLLLDMQDACADFAALAGLELP